MTLSSSLTRGAKGGTRAPQFVLDRVIVDENGCWIWQRARDRAGYARAPHGVNAHRLSYTLFKGPIAEGLQIDHLCRVRACVNPEHLEPVTAAENLRRSPDTITARQRRLTHCSHGHPFDKANTYIRPTGTRDCRACGRARTARYQGRKAAA
jgi:hypothetical protein